MVWKNTQEKAYWFEDMPAAKCADGKSLTRRTEILIIGGGYTGITAAIKLREKGVPTTVIDSKPMGTGASARNGGMALTGLSENLSKIIKRHGLELTRRLFEESTAAVDLVENIIEQGSIDCGFKRTGHLEAAFKATHFDDLKEHQDLLNEQFNFPTRLVSTGDIKEEIGSDLYHGGLITPLGAGLHPAQYIAGLINMALSAGAGLHEGVTANRILKHKTGFEVKTSHGSIFADKVIVATNGYTGSLTPWQRRRVIPVRSLMIATAPLDPDQARALIPRDRMISDTKIFLYYFRMSPDGRRLLFGGRPQLPAKSLAENARLMRLNMLQVYPQLKDTDIDFMWWGKLGFTMDRTPHIGIHEGVLYAMGYCGHGVAMATYFGEKLARMALGSSDPTEFIKPAFRLIPFYNGRPWFLPLVYTYFSLKDRFS